MDKFLYYNDLLNIYKTLLTEKEQAIFSDYYEENLSMGEIAENLSITRSAVGSTIKTVEQKLEKYESCLQIRNKNKKLQAIIEEIEDKKIKGKLEELLN